MSAHKSKTLRVLFSAAFTLVLLEIMLRFFWLLPVTAKGAYLCRDDVADHNHYPYGIGRMRSGGEYNEFNIVLRMNNIGMRDDDVGAKLPGKKRLLIIGDSFMEGWGCERGDIFTDRIETDLKKRGADVEAVAAGVASWSTLTELAWLRHTGMALQPDAVVLAFDATDPSGDSFYAHRLVRDAMGRPDFIAPGHRALDLPKPLHNFLSKHSFIYRYIDRILTKKFPATKWDYGFWADSDDVWAPVRSERELPEPKYSSYWTHTREAMNVMRDILAERGIPLLVIQYPTGVETDSKAWAKGRGTANFGEGMIAPRRFDFMLKFTDADSIPYFSLLPAFQHHPSPASLFFPYDGHWSKEGHQLAAEAVADELMRRGTF